MKKLLTLFIAFLTLTMGAQKAYAQPIETLEVTMKSGTYLKVHPESAFALEFLAMVNQIKFTQEGNISYVYSMSDKHLMTINTDNSYVTLAPNVTDADDISYTITDADREMLRETDMDIYDVLKDYKAIKLHFVATELRDLVVTLKTGKNIYPNTENLYAIYSLIIFGQIAQDSESFSFLSLDNKLLFTFTPFEEGENMHYVVNLAHSISSADDIVYTITDQDREILEALDDPTYKTLLADCKTIQLHFDTSTGEDVEADWVANIKTGASMQDNNTFLPIYFMCNVFHQIKLSIDEDTGLGVYSSLNDKTLFYYDENDMSITVAPGVGPANDIIYTITDEDRMQLQKNQELYPYIASVKTIQLHFIANDQQQEEDWVAWLKTGDNMGTNTKAQTAVFCLFILNQVQYVEEGNDEVVYSMTDKKLFIIEGSTGNVTLAPGVSSADDIIHTLTSGDLEILRSANKSIYNKLKDCKTVELHFDVEPVEPKVQAVTFDFSEITLRPGQELQLDPHFTPAEVEDKTLRYVDASNGHHVYIDSDNGIIFAQSEGVAYIEAFSSYTASGEEVMATWGPTQEIYLKITITALEPGQEVFFDYKEGEGTEAPTISCHVLRDEVLDVNTWVKTCEIAGPYNEDDITTLAIPEWRTGTVNIPEEAMGYEVVRVGAYSFYESQISALYIPWTVTQIGREACARCDYLTDVYIASFQPLQFTDAYGDLMEESMGHNDAFYRIGEGDDGEGYATLHVLPGSKAAWDIYPWNEWFRYIKEDTPIPVDIKGLTPNPSPVGEGSIYNLAGQRLSKMQKGINIINGHKIIRK